MDRREDQAIGEQSSGWSEVREAKYISAEEAWESFKKEYFEGMEELADGFEADNPLAGSASYEIFLKDISKQDMIVKRLEGHGRRAKGALFQCSGGRLYQLQER